MSAPAIDQPLPQNARIPLIWIPVLTVKYTFPLALLHTSMLFAGLATLGNTILQVRIMASYVAIMYGVSFVCVVFGVSTTRTSGDFFLVTWRIVSAALFNIGFVAGVLYSLRSLKADLSELFFGILMVIVLLASFVITYMQDRMYVGATREAARMDRPLASLEMLRGWIARAKALAWRGQQQNRAEAYELRVNAQPAQPAASGTLFLQWPPQLLCTHPPKQGLDDFPELKESLIHANSDEYIV